MQQKKLWIGFLRPVYKVIAVEKLRPIILLILRINVHYKLAFHKK